MVIVLFISGLFFSLGIGPGKRALANLNEQMFFRDLRQLWFATFYRCIQNNTVAIIYVEDDKIIFSDSADHKTILTYPKTLHHASGVSTYIIQKTGSMRPDTEEFSSTLGKVYDMHVQLGYGMQYRLEVKNE
ncbi:hypothetical protein FC32_GL001953 [Ligilactobacillus apodemi DSM 16634 = JCM 16172]|uniref:Uncharacterized protein n=2 Tax=Ligilactobacillus TaxID=2767887 RepID=A0A0R1U466_9LACO|nr:hypothetical protein FC32_GL001953 [Ligilactobacillus apodemi DSM 16634 = JCM 16172]